MSEIIFMSVPLALAASISPGCFVLFIKVLFEKQHPRRNGLTYLIGAIIANIAILAFALATFGYTAPVRMPHPLLHAIIDFILAGLSVTMLIKMFAKKPEHVKATSKKPAGVVGYLLTGFMMKLLEASNLPPLIGAVHSVRGAGVVFTVALPAYILVLALSVLPLLATYAVFIANKQLALTLIAPIGNFIEKYKDRMVKIALTLVTILLALSGVLHLAKL
ncbi:MAG: GAP family protein [Negativicutes bacterium]